MNWFSDLFSSAQEWLFTTVMQPLLFSLGLANLLEDGYEATAWLLAGVLQIIVLLAIIGPLQRWRPVEAVTDRATIRVDVLYTLIHRLGLFRIALFLRWSRGLTKRLARCVLPVTAPFIWISSGPV